VSPRRSELLRGSPGSAERAREAKALRDYRGDGTPRATLLLHEKNGQENILPVHHRAAECLDGYIAMAGLAGQPDAPLWQHAPGHARLLTGDALTARGALDIVKRCCRAAAAPGHLQSFVPSGPRA
jgi:hypothetical protein